ncbi:hypothetical protein DAPPUDRAFT_246013 [Daphnia pulex]|uniref:Uncharacterized protein n=1 Tax=Daphnia pulex TaxID=6669 RepID=E9GPG9_DAPPU|nr:hypothetical protein DAPPUDRAFT_246013 [Daphnia pulex]|eukprot:EFX78679.1 hypothetical protein DAPPUDRAFT_246013 [Daphnia pulex]
MDTPLIVTAQNSAIRAITSLTALDADVDAQEANGNTAMHYAVLNSSDREIDRSHTRTRTSIYQTPLEEPLCISCQLAIAQI